MTNRNLIALAALVIVPLSGCDQTATPQARVVQLAPGTAQGTSGGSVTIDNVTRLFNWTFDHHAPGTYIESQRQSDFGDTDINYGIEERRVFVTAFGEGNTPGLEIRYPAGAINTKNTGATWRVPLGGQFEEVTLSYDLNFTGHFDWSPDPDATNNRRGGKLPGLTGHGLAATGGERANGHNGWSSRLVWFEQGRLCQYVYHMDQATDFGDCFHFTKGATPMSAAENLATPSSDRLTVADNAFHHYSQTIRMNTVGQADGEIIVHLNGQKVAHITGLRFRTTPALAIEDFYLTAFLGGGSNYAMDRASRIVLDNISITTPR